jgi:dihydropteroate synthase
MAYLQCGARQLDLSNTHVMGILNVTPDSFSDGGSLFANDKIDLSELVFKAEQMVANGATILDIGGESTRPNAAEVTPQQEMDRVLPALEVLSNNLDVVISVDTSNAQLMTESAKLGAGLINDVRALERPGALMAATDSGLPVCLMHMKGTPKTMQNNPQYDDVVDQVKGYLLERVAACEKAGIAKEQIILDPGIGFGKTLEQNLALISNAKAFIETGHPYLLGVSRKSMFAQLLGREVDERLAGGLATTAFAVMQGVSIVRVHDVKETADVVKVVETLQKGIQ